MRQWQTLDIEQTLHEVRVRVYNTGVAVVESYSHITMAKEEDKNGRIFSNLSDGGSFRPFALNNDRLSMLDAASVPCEGETEEWASRSWPVLF